MLGTQRTIGTISVLKEFINQVSNDIIVILKELFF